ELAQVMHIFAERATYPVMLHCTQGKDRTGIVIVVLLLLLRVPVAAVTEDYTRSEPELLPEREIRLKDIEEVGLSREFADAPKEWVTEVKGHLDERYGGVEKYLRDIGVGDEVQKRRVETLRSKTL